ncbi:MAG TPA: hypothetical protein VE224_09180 [Pseudolabrys sp.]|nr:hypothetical protein [Pseudolabrys sp.]
MKRLVLSFALATLTAYLLAVAPGMAAPQRKPDAVIKTQAIDAGITVDPALETYPGLYPRLLAAGKREMQKWRAAADKDYRESRKFFADERRDEFDLGYEQRSAVQGYVSILRTDFSYSVGAAHPNHGINTLLWDTHTRRFISIRPFFEEIRTNGPTMRTLAAAIKKAVVAAKIKRGLPASDANDPMWVGSIEPDITKIGGVALAPSTEPDKSAGLLVYFGPYAVGAYVEGDYIVFVPWTDFKTHLSRAGVVLFGGTRPPGDAERDEP